MPLHEVILPEFPPESASPDGVEPLDERVQRIGGGVVHPGWEVWRDGVYRLEDGTGASDIPADVGRVIPAGRKRDRRRIALRPMWIDMVGRVIDTDEMLVCLCYLTPTGDPMRLWVARGEITDTLLLGKLGRDNAPVDSLNARDMLVYLRACEDVCSTYAPRVLVGGRSGPYVTGGTAGWLVGERWIGTGNVVADPRHTSRKRRRALATAGSRDAWIAKWRELREESWVRRWLVACTFAPPLLRHCSMRSFVVHHWGPSGGGKSAMAVFALSAWGDPTKLFQTQDATEISLTEIFTEMTDLPVLYDEQQLGKVDPGFLVYSVTAPVGRGRASRTGGLRDRTDWLTVARTTGEVPVLRAGDLGGQSSRVIQIHGRAFATRSQASSIYPFAGEHHGWAGPEFLHHLRELVHRPDGMGTALARDTYKDLGRRIAAEFGIESNQVAYAASIALGQILSNHWLLGMDMDAARREAVADGVQALSESGPLQMVPYAERALGRLKDHWVANPWMYGSTDDEKAQQSAAAQKRVVGFDTAAGMVYIPHEADEILRDAGYEPERVWRDFAAAGWLLCDHEGRLTVSMNLGRSTGHRVRCILRDAWLSDGRLQSLEGDGNVVVARALPALAVPGGGDTSGGVLRLVHERE